MRLNFYTVKFQAVCPADGTSIDYAASISSAAMIRVEEIVLFTSAIAEGFQEDIADQLYERFSSTLCLKGIHQGVLITSFRGGLEQQSACGQGWVIDHLALLSGPTQIALGETQ
ncbi:MAG: hypothetical protein E6R08_00330 [Nevskiaceae bacterium]|nr:MAG: hypothetical protein E6R08_00330 [Nevskiaceae bacterium]